MIFLPVSPDVVNTCRFLTSNGHFLQYTEAAAMRVAANGRCPSQHDVRAIILGFIGREPASDALDMASKKVYTEDDLLR